MHRRESVVVLVTALTFSYIDTPLSQDRTIIGVILSAVVVAFEQPSAANDWISPMVSGPFFIYPLSHEEPPHSFSMWGFTSLYAVSFPQ